MYEKKTFSLMFLFCKLSDDINPMKEEKPAHGLRGDAFFVESMPS